MLKKKISEITREITDITSEIDKLKNLLLNQNLMNHLV